MLKNDRWICSMAKKGMIKPFNRKQIKKRVISYGVSSYGYDMRVADEFKVFSNISSTLIDPKNLDKNNFTNVRGSECIIPANSFILARSLEYFRIPREVLVVCLGKSTYARCGVVINVTPLEPEWEGYVTISISNTSPLPVKIYAKEGIAQLLFLEGAEVCARSYADKAGKYQAQKNITLSKI